MKHFHSLTALLLAGALAVSAAAVSTEMPEGASEVFAVSEEASVSSAINSEYASYNDPTYGKLVYYNDFESYADGTVFPYSNPVKTGHTYVDTSIFKSDITIRNNESGTTAIATLDGNRVLRYDEKWAFSSVMFSFGSVTAKGSYTVMADFLVPESSSGPVCRAFWYFNDDGDTSRKQIGYNKNITNTGVWVQDTVSGAVKVVPAGEANLDTNSVKSINDIYVFCDARSSGLAGNVVYIDNVRVFFNPTTSVSYDLVLPPDRQASDVKDLEASSGMDIYSTPYGGTPVTFDLASTQAVPGGKLPELFVSGYSFVGWTDDDGNDLYRVPTEGGNLYTWWTDYAPGVNMITGKTETYGFESGDRLVFVSGTTRPRVLADNPDKSDANPSDTVLKFTQSGANYVAYSIPVGLEEGRKYHIVFDSRVTTASGSTDGINPQAWMMDFEGLNKNYLFSFGSSLNGWQHHEYDLVSRGMDFAELQFKFQGHTTEDTYTYFDNVGIFPFYRVTYIDTDGTETVVYVDPMQTEYTPDASVFKNSKTATIDFVPMSGLYYPDDTLYPVDTTLTLDYSDIVIHACKLDMILSDGTDTVGTLPIAPGRDIVFPDAKTLGLDYDPLFTVGGMTFAPGDVYHVPADTADDLLAEISEDDAAGIKTLDKTQLRFDAPFGLRFAAFIGNTVRADADEYGFIIARAADLPADDSGNRDTSALVFENAQSVGEENGILANGGKFVYGKNYVKDSVDLVYSLDGSDFGEGIAYEEDDPLGGVYVTAVLYGFEGYDQYAVELATRPYLKKGDTTIYGRTVFGSMYDTALALKAAGIENERVDAIIDSKPVE